MAASVVTGALGIPPSHIRQVSADRVTCLITEEWLRDVIQQSIQPLCADHILERSRSDSYLAPSCDEIPSPWKRLTVKIVAKSDNLVPRFPGAPLYDPSSASCLTELLASISRQNFQNLWEETFHKYGHKTQEPLPAESRTFTATVWKMVLRFCPRVVLAMQQTKTKTTPQSEENSASDIDYNLLPVLGLVESVDHIFVLQPYIPYSLRDVISYSPALLDTSYTKAMFIIYQILQAMKALHCKGLTTPSLNLTQILIDNKLWVYLGIPSLSNLISQCADDNQEISPTLSEQVHESISSVKAPESSSSDPLQRTSSTKTSSIVQESLNSVQNSVRDLATGDKSNDQNMQASQQANSDTKSTLSAALKTGSIKNSQTSLEDAMAFMASAQYTAYSVDDLGNVVNEWVHGKISNFKYLMILNHLAGRRMDDPNHHPVLPWVMDFSSNVGEFRDFNLSKFRINKGDSQLDITYEPLPTLAGGIGPGDDPLLHVPHHISDVLSDITYYVYKARRTSKVILCSHVRSKWVPNEYPSSMVRMQQWTPDECIPEFFTDPTIFTSIHEDLPNLEIPPWSSSPQNFIRRHLEVMENDYVSSRLHHWIDLTFGHNLSGSSAVKAKNVYLQLVNQHTHLTNHGVVQLFLQPHPPRQTIASLMMDIPPKIPRNLLYQFSDPLDGGNGDRQSQTRPDQAIIRLPDEFNPLKALEQMEMMCSFSIKTQIKATTTNENQPSSPDLGTTDPSILVSRDMQVFGCVICELFLAPKMRMLGPGASLRERFELIQEHLASDDTLLPRCVRRAVKSLLLLGDKSLPGISDLLFSYPVISTDGLPPLTPALLLQPHIELLPFPKYFPDLYKCLASLKQKDHEIENVTYSSRTNAERIKLIKILSREKVIILETYLRSSHFKLAPEEIDLILPYLQELFDNPITNVQAAWSLFYLISQELGPKEMSRRFLTSVTKLYIGDFSSPKHLKLYHRSFLTQLMLGIGLQTFLSNFSTLLVEAVSGYKDFMLNDDGENPSTEEEPFHRHSPSPVLSDVIQNEAHSLTEVLKQNPIIEMNSAEPIAIMDPECSDNTPEDVDEEFPDEVLLGEDDRNMEKDVALLDTISWGQTSNVSEGSLGGFSGGGEEDDDSGGGKPGSAERVSIHSISHIMAMRSNPSGSSEPEASSDIEDPNTPVFNAEDPNMSVFDTEGPITPVYVPQNVQSEAMSSLHSRPSSEQLCDDAERTINVEVSEIIRNGEDGTSEYEDIEDIEVGVQDVFDSMVRSETDEFTTMYGEGTDDSGNICHVAVESTKWLAHRLGPFLTAKYLSRNMIRMAALCYLGDEQLTVIDSKAFTDMKTSQCISGDVNSQYLMECLTFVAVLYGEQVVLIQYLPCITDMIKAGVRSLTARAEASMFAALVLLRQIVMLLSDKTIMDVLVDSIVKELLYPVIKLISSNKICFPGGHHSRTIMCHKTIDVIFIIGLRIGFEYTRKMLTGLLQRFFSAFNLVHSSNPQQTLSGELAANTSMSGLFDSNSTDETYLNIKIDSVTHEYKIGSPVNIRASRSLSPSGAEDRDEWQDKAHISSIGVDAELAAVFTCEMAHAAYIPFCRIFGRIHVEQYLKNDDLIRSLCSQYDNGLDRLTDSTEEPKEQAEVNNVSDMGSNVAMVGNRISLQTDSGTNPVEAMRPGITYRQTGILSIDPDELYCFDMERNKSRHLRGNWLAYWEHELGLSDRDNLFNFKQIKLQTFAGHNNSIRAISVMDNENSFISASKDKTVKLWSLRSYSDGTGKCSPQHTYTEHKKSVFSVAFVESVRLVASCDSIVHVWDPFTGQCIKRLESAKNTPVVALMPMSPPSTNLITATTDATLRFLDLRTAKYAHEYRCSAGSAGLIRCVAVSPDSSWIAVGFSSGFISLMDLRMGPLLATWKGHDGEILQIKSYNKNAFVSSSFDQTMKLWDVENAKEIGTLKGHTDPAHCISFYRNQVISATTYNKIGVHSSVDSHAYFTSTKLRTDTFKGVLTSMAVLPLNRTLLLGADNGTIRLLC